MRLFLYISPHGLITFTKSLHNFSHVAEPRATSPDATCCGRPRGTPLGAPQHVPNSRESRISDRGNTRSRKTQNFVPLNINRLSPSHTSFQHKKHPKMGIFAPFSAGPNSTRCLAFFLNIYSIRLLHLPLGRGLWRGTPVTGKRRGRRQKDFRSARGCILTDSG